MVIFCRWQETSPGEWTSVLAGFVWKLSQPSSEAIDYEVYGLHKPTLDPQEIHAEDTEGNGALALKNTKYFQDILHDYFQLNVNVTDLYKTWCSKDKAFEKVAEHVTGVRTLRQDPVENLFSFICSSNNHITRIGSMVEKLCDNYGEKVMELDGKTYFSFPTIESLAATGVEEKLRQLGFGYRAKYINQSAQHIHNDKGGVEWLFSLREKPYGEAKAELMKLHGVGAKVSTDLCGRLRAHLVLLNPVL